MFISDIIKVKEFSAMTNKEAYLKACKWVSANIIAVNNSNNISYKIEKIKSNDYMSKVKLTVYVMEDEEVIHNNHCGICQELANGLYMKENKFRCEVCKTIPYRTRLSNRLENLKKGLMEKLGL